MKRKLTNAIASKVGSDEGGFFPDKKAGWAITNIGP